MKKLFAGILIVTMVFFAGCTKQTVETETGEKVEIVAKIGEEAITLNDFNRNYAIVENTYKEIYGEDIMNQMVGEQTISALVKEQILDNMVTERIVKKALEAKGVEITEAQIKDNYNRFYEQQMKNNETLQSFYTANNIDEAFILTQLENQLYVNELKNQVKEEINTNIASNEEAFKLNKVKVKASHILVEDLPLAEEILTKIQGGEDFATLAKAHSIDPGSKDNGGDLDYFTRGQMVKPFEDSAFALNINQVSGIVASEFGYHIIKCTDFKTLKDLETEGLSQEELKLQKDGVIASMVESKYAEQVNAFKNLQPVEIYSEAIQ